MNNGTAQQEFLDPLLAPPLKGYPLGCAGMRRSAVGQAGWNVLAGDLPLPLALVKRTALEHNLHRMQALARGWGVDLAPHGKTTMSPQIFRRQLDAGAWGLTFANVTQLAVGVAAGVRRALIANQLVSDADLAAVAALRRAHGDLRVLFLVDSLAQLALIDDWARRQRPAPAPFEVLLEIGVAHARSGCRTQQQALELAAALQHSSAVQLAGIECYEGLGASGQSAPDQAYVQALMERVSAVARHCALARWFAAGEVLISAGGSALFDLVATQLKPALHGGHSVRGLLRSGCYVTHDHGFYRQMLHALEQRLDGAAACGGGTVCGGARLLPALEVWATVQSCPEPGLAILAVGKRDLSYDLALPLPIARAARARLQAASVPPGWRIAALYDQHACLRWPESEQAQAPLVGERVGLGISHPCTTFDKWHWMPLVEDDYRVSDALVMHF